MINFRTPIIGINDTVSNPVLISILQSLKYTLDIKEDTKVITTQDVDEIVRKTWNLKETVTDSDFAENILSVSTAESTMDDSAYIRPMENHNRPLFKDGTVSLKPAYLNTEMVITIGVKSKSKSYVVAMRDKIKSLLLSGADVETHDITYRYYLPKKAALLILASFHYKNNYGLANNYTKYILGQSDNRLSLVSTQGGTTQNIDIVCIESQEGALGRFDFDLNKQISSDKSVYSFEFEYKLTYNRPTFIDVYYDIVIANQQLPDALTMTQSTMDKASRDEINDFLSPIRIDAWMLSNILEVYNRSYIRLPFIDNHRTIERNRFELILFSALTTITPNDKRNLFNFYDLPDIELAKSVLEYLKFDREFVPLTLQSFFNIYIYSNESERIDIPLKIDSDLNVYSDIELDLSETYRVIFVLNTNEKLLTSQARIRYRDFIKVHGLIDNILLISNNYNKYMNVVNSFGNSGTIYANGKLIYGHLQNSNTVLSIINQLITNVDKSLIKFDSSLLDIPNKAFVKTVQAAAIMAHFKERK